MNPASIVVPLLGLSADRAPQFLGTGSFVGPKGLLLTADHVIRDWKGDLAIVSMMDVTKPHPAVILERDEAHDLALLRVGSYSLDTWLKPSFTGPFYPDRTMLTYEYGTTERSGDNTFFNPATRVGNITRMFQSLEILGKAGESALELSFPALKGASGAPVIDREAKSILGVIVANVSYELLPSQIESVLDEKNNIYEETKFMMPQAVAVNIQHLKSMYERFSV